MSALFNGKPLHHTVEQVHI